jgi:transcriptional regulator with XRE-family HTH domain
LPKFALTALGKMVREKRGARKLREVAGEIAISPATLMRIEAGRIPDVATFGKICRWLQVDPADFLGSPSKHSQSTGLDEPPVRVSAHFRADRLPLPETASALARMLLFIAQRQAAGTLRLDDADA